MESGSTAATALERLGGCVAGHMGDGVLACFGYPRAHEDDPVRALGAGLDLVDSVASSLPYIPSAHIERRRRWHVSDNPEQVRLFRAVVMNSPIPR